jgi:hypothetical protein
MTAAGVPVVPGYHGDAQDVATLRKVIHPRLAHGHAPHLTLMVPMATGDRNRKH